MIASLYIVNFTCFRIDRTRWPQFVTHKTHEVDMPTGQTGMIGLFVGRSVGAKLWSHSFNWSALRKFVT